MSTEYTTKICSKCQKTLPATLEYFPPRKNTYDGLRADCCVCYSLYKQQYRLKNIERELARSRERYHLKLESDIQTRAKWHEENREYLLEEMQKYHAAHREEANTRRRKHYYANRESNLQKLKQDRKNNPEKYKVYRKREREKNKERYLTYGAKYRKEHKAEIYAIIKEWKANNRPKTRLYQSNYESRNRGAEGRFTFTDIENIAIEQDFCCYYCGIPNAKLTIDHKTPISRDGTNYPVNLCLACGPCNSSKGDKTEAEFWDYLEKKKRS